MLIYTLNIIVISNDINEDKIIFLTLNQCKGAGRSAIFFSKEVYTLLGK